MGIDIMKSSGTRCPPILVAGLLIMCLYLACNWWSYSSENTELLTQLENLSEQLKRNGDELGKCSQEKILFDEKLKDSQNRFVQLQIKMEQIKETEDEVKESNRKFESELQESQKKSDSVEKTLKLCQVEMESLKKLGESKDKTTEALRSENESLKSEIEQKDKYIKELERQFKSVNKSGSVLSKNKIIQSIAQNLKANTKKNIPEIIISKNEKGANSKGLGVQQIEGDVKTYGDSGLLSLDNDPREEEMKDS